MVRQVLTESLLLAVAGGGLGLAITVAALAVLRRLHPANLPRLADIELDGDGARLHRRDLRGDVGAVRAGAGAARRGDRSRRSISRPEAGAAAAATGDGRAIS